MINRINKMTREHNKMTKMYTQFILKLNLIQNMNKYYSNI